MRGRNPAGRSRCRACGFRGSCSCPPFPATRHGSCRTAAQPPPWPGRGFFLFLAQRAFLFLAKQLDGYVEELAVLLAGAAEPEEEAQPQFLLSGAHRTREDLHILAQLGVLLHERADPLVEGVNLLPFLRVRLFQLGDAHAQPGEFLFVRHGGSVSDSANIVNTTLFAQTI